MKPSGIDEIPPVPARSASSSAVGIRRKLAENWALFTSYVRESPRRRDIAIMFEELDEYEAILRTHNAPPLSRSTVLEVGFGARPFRLVAMQSIGADAAGIDMDVPVLGLNPVALFRVLRANGIERFLKTFVRAVAFDWRDERHFRRALRERGLSYRRARDKFLVGDAAELDLEPNSLDLIVSEDVFEHISAQSLDVLLPKMARWLRPGGLALIRPNIFPGITGGHQIDWRLLSFERPVLRRTEPWDHLRSRLCPPNTYLNELWRTDYRRLFGDYFEICEERVKHPNLGRDYLAGDVAEQLSDVDVEELFSNQVLFVLRPHR